MLSLNIYPANTMICKQNVHNLTVPLQEHLVFAKLHIQNIGNIYGKVLEQEQKFNKNTTTATTIITNRMGEFTDYMFLNQAT